MVTLALGITAPETSVTVPNTSPVLTCPTRYGIAGNSSKNSRRWIRDGLLDTWLSSHHLSGDHDTRHHKAVRVAPVSMPPEHPECRSLLSYSPCCGCHKIEEGYPGLWEPFS